MMKFKETEQSLILTMRFIGIVLSVLVSGSCYNGTGASNFAALNTSKSTWHIFRTYSEHPVLEVKSTICDHSKYKWLFIVE